ncbi:MAG: zinc ribbon domain-containing protein [Desulfocapsaceae bacterium]|jgi:putative FmdB family regulatory protein|nr:zinc ribbon domain-containing protein [Desulfocapsaceae bacterium]
MPVYEYECKECRKVYEVQQKMADAPLAACPDCRGPVTKLISMNSFQLKGSGWYADGYASPSTGASAPAAESTPATPPCQTESGCKSCPAAATGK